MPGSSSGPPRCRQRQQAGHRRLEPIAGQLRVLGDGGRRRRERLEDRDRDTCRAARRVDRELGRVAKPLDALSVFTPPGEAFLPHLGLLLRILQDRHTLDARVVRVDPRLEILGGQPREGQQQVAEVALGIDGDHGQAVDGSLLDQRDAQARLAAARHADADGVRHQVLRVVQNGLIAGLFRPNVVLAAEVEDTQLLEVLHRALRGVPSGYVAVGRLSTARRAHLAPGPTSTDQRCASSSCTRIDEELARK
jgi:hypothetical protein